MADRNSSPIGSERKMGQIPFSFPDDEKQERKSRAISTLNGLPWYPKRNIWIFLLFQVFVFVRYIQLGARRDYFGTFRVEFIIGLFVIILVGLQLFSRKPVIGNTKPLLVVISLLLFAIIIQVPLAVDPVRAQTVFLDKVIKFVFLTFIMAVMIESPKYLRLFLATYLFSLFYVYQEAVYGLITGSLIWYNQGILRLHGAVPIYANPNSLGGVAIDSLPFVVFLFSQVKRKLFRVFFLPVAASSLACIIYSGSRTAYVGLLALIIWWWFQSRKKLKFIFFAIIFGLIAIPKIPADYIGRFESISGKEAAGHSKEGRKSLLQDAIVVFMENPFGLGVGSFPKARLLRFGRRAADTHNLFLEIGTNLGIQGLLIFFTLIVLLMYYLRRAAFDFRRQRNMLGSSLKTSRPPPSLRKVVMIHDNDLRFLIAVCQASGGFIFVRLVLGLFGMDLYEPYWWFGSGLAFVLSGLAFRVRKNTAILIENLGDYSFNGPP